MAAVNRQSLHRQALVMYGLMLAIFFVASFFPEQRVWGVAWYGYFGWSGRLLLIGAGIMLPFVVAMLVRKFSTEAATPANPRTYYIAVSIIVALFALAFYLFSVRIHFLGDGYLLLSRFEGSTFIIKPWETVIYTVQRLVFSMLGSTTNTGASVDTARLTFQLIAYVCGISLLSATAFAAKHLFESMWDRFIFVLGMASSGYMLLFFGYVENYSLLVLAVALFSLAGLLAAQEKLGSVLTLIPMMAAIALHPFGLSLLPAAAWLIFRQTTLGRWLLSGPRLPRLLVWGAVAVTIGLAFLYFYTESYFFRFAFVPPMMDIFTAEGYTLFSVKHLLDFANLMVQFVPGLLLFILIALYLPLRQLWQRPEYRFLLLLVLPSLAIVFVMDPKLGMSRDWDLFCFAGIPLALLCFFSLLDNKKVIRQYVPIALLPIGLGFLLLAPRVATQVIPQKGVAVFDHQADLDPLRSGPGRWMLVDYFRDLGDEDEVRRRKVINDAVMRDRTLLDSADVLRLVGKVGEATVVYRKAIAFNPASSFAWAALGYEFIEQGIFDSALIYFRIADGLNPYNYATCNGLGLANCGLGEFDRAEEYWLLSMRTNPKHKVSRTLLLELYMRQNRPADIEKLSP